MARLIPKASSGQATQAERISYHCSNGIPLPVQGLFRGGNMDQNLKENSFLYCLCTRSGKICSVMINAFTPVHPIQI